MIDSDHDAVDSIAIARRSSSRSAPQPLERFPVRWNQLTDKKSPFFQRGGAFSRSQKSSTSVENALAFRGDRFDHAMGPYVSKCPSFFDNSSSFDSHCVALAQTIENQVIPRLLLAHRCETRAVPLETPSRSALAPNVIADFVIRVTTQDDAVMHAHVASLLAAGMTLDSVCLDILAPAARHLGERWSCDESTFADVTLALFSLQRLLRHFSQNHAMTSAAQTGTRILLAPIPSTQHTFGILMVEDFFKRSGWDVFCMPACTAKSLVGAVRAEWFAAIGLSTSRDCDAKALPSLIRMLRKASRNRSIAVLVGGGYFNDHPEQVLRVGADATATDATLAVTQAQRLIQSVSRH